MLSPSRRYRESALLLHQQKQSIRDPKKRNKLFSWGVMAGTGGIDITKIIEFVGDLLQLEAAHLQKQATKKQAAEQAHISANDPKGVERYFRTLESYLKDMDGRDLKGSSSLMQHVKEARGFAFDIEDIGEECMLQVPHHFHDHKITLYLHKAHHSRANHKALNQLSSRMNKVLSNIDKAIKLKKFSAPPFVSASSQIYADQGAPPESYSYPDVKGEELVGIDERLPQFLDLFLESRLEEFVISVLGPRGSGKTTLVRMAYEILKKDFPYHALITTGMATVERICAEMGLSVPQGADAKQKLRSYLETKKYLLVIDRIQSKEGWNSINGALPDHSRGSKIVICTTQHDLASYCARPSGCVHHLPLLNNEEAMELFCLRAFHDKRCPKHLTDLSKSILKKCEGLPIAIAAVGNSLAAKPKRASEFNELLKSLGYELETNRSLSIMGKILREEYTQLSHNLRSCFLYLCNFPEACSISRGRLLRLWIAERLVEKIDNKTMEQVADDYLDELIQRNLVYVIERDFEGRVRSCRVGSMVREFITSESQKKCFSTVLTAANRSSLDEARRLSLHNVSIEGLGQLIKEGQGQQSKLKHIRSLMIFGGEAQQEATAETLRQRTQKLLRDLGLLMLFDPEALEMGPSLLVIELLRRLKLVRVLELEDAALKSFPTEVVKHSLLRYLSLRGNTAIDKVPKSIGKLSRLETLDLRGTSVTKLPKAILKLRELLYLLVDSRYENGDRIGVEVPGRIGYLSALQKLTLIKARKSQHHILVKELEKLTELRTLGITNVREEDGKVLCQSIQSMENLSSLSVTSAGKGMSLDLEYMSMPPSILHNLQLGGRLRKIPDWVCSVHSLAKIKLKWSKLEASPLEALHALPSLCELELTDAYTGKVMSVRDGWFKKLKILELAQFHQLQQVTITHGAMPQLQKLVLRKCHGLRTVPIGIHKLTRLKELLLSDMPEQLIDRSTGEDRRFVKQIS